MEMPNQRRAPSVLDRDHLFYPHGRLTSRIIVVRWANATPERKIPLDFTDADLPGIWKNSDMASKRGQHWTLWLTRIKVGAGVLAAFGGTLSLTIERIDIAGWLVLFGFLIALCAEIVAWVMQPEKLWYEGRAVAESAKTLAWRYSVGADPFSVDISSSIAQKELRNRISNVADQVAERIIFDSEQPAVTSTMDELRSRPFEVRRDTYLNCRTLDQQRWYADKARFNRHRANTWRVILLVAELVASVFAAGRVFGGWSIDFAGLLAALIAGGTAWVAVKQFSPLASAYAIAAKELGIQKLKLSSVEETEWQLVAADAEEAISREHTSWLASRTGRTSRLIEP